MSILSISIDLLRCIDWYLTPVTIIRLSQTCTQLRDIFSRERFWHRRLVRDYPEEVACSLAKDYKRWYCDLYYMPSSIREICEKGEQEYQELMKLMNTLNSYARHEQVIDEGDDEDEVLTNSFSLIFVSRIWPIPVVVPFGGDNVLTHRRGSAFVEIMYHIDEEANTVYYRAILTQQGECYATLAQVDIWLQSIKITHRAVPSPVASYICADANPRYFKLCK